MSIRLSAPAIPAPTPRTTATTSRPQELVKIQRQARGLGLDIVGFYHSHPDHPAQWSPTDFAEAHWIGCSYVITAVEKGKAAITNSFLLTGTSEEDKKFEDEAIEIDVVEHVIPTERSGMKIHIPTPLRTYTAEPRRSQLPARTVAEVFSNLTTQYPELQQHLFTTDGKLRSFVNVYLNDETSAIFPRKKQPPSPRPTSSPSSPPSPADCL